MKKAYWIDGRLLTDRDLQDIRAQLEKFGRVVVSHFEMFSPVQLDSFSRALTCRARSRHWRATSAKLNRASRSVAAAAIASQ